MAATKSSGVWDGDLRQPRRAMRLTIRSYQRAADSRGARIRMRPQTTVTQTADQPPEIQQSDQDCGERDEPAQPAYRKIGEVPLRAPCDRSRRDAAAHPPATRQRNAGCYIAASFPKVRWWLAS